MISSVADGINNTTNTTYSSSDSPFWPPFKALYDYVEHVKFELGGLPEVSKEQEAFLRLYEGWISRGLLGFMPYKSENGNKQSQRGKVSFPVFRKLDNGLVELDGTTDVPIDDKMRVAGKEIGSCLNIDEEQALYLLHVWQKRMYGSEESQLHSPSAVQTANKRFREEECVLSEDGHLSMQQLASIAELYCEERLNLLKSLEGILWIGEEPTECPARDFMEGLIGDLLSGEGKLDIEEATVRSLTEQAKYRNSPAQKTVIMGQGKDNASYSWAILMVQGMERERATLLCILMILYYHPRKQCSAKRFLELFSIGRDHLVNRTIGLARADISNVSDRLAIMLLLEILVLDIGQPLRMVAEGQIPNEEHYIFLQKDIMHRISEDMKTFAASRHYLSGPLVLTWASIVIVLGKETKTGSDLVSTLDHNRVLRDYLLLIELPGQSKQLNSLIMYHSLAILLTAFGLDPEIIPVEETKSITKLICAIFEQRLVSDSFLLNLGDALTEPMLKFLDACAGFFPASPEYLLDLLSSVCKSYEGSLFAVEYFKNLCNITVAYSGEIDDVQIEGVRAIANTDLKQRGTPFGIIKQGTRGKFFNAPSGTESWVFRNQKISYISWDIQFEENQSSALLLWRLVYGIHHLSSCPEKTFDVLIMEIESVLNFYESVFTSNDLFVVEMINQGIVFEGEAGNEEHMDFTTVIGACISNLVLTGSKAPELEIYNALALCLKILSFLVPYTPDRVFSILTSGLGISTVQLKLSQTMHGGSTLPMFDQMMASWTKGRKAMYQTILHFFQLVSVFLQTEYGPTENIICLALDMTRVAVPYIACQAGGEEKWNLSAACITVVRHTLLLERNRDDDSKFQSTKEILKIIYPLLPPNAKQIRHDVDHQDEAEAIEKCCVKWLRLVPVLLSGSNDRDDMCFQENTEATRRFNEAYLFTSVDGVSPSPATTLLSYLSYPYFCSEDKAAVVRSISCLLSFDSKVPITSFLPKDGPRLSFLEPCMVIANAVNASSPTHIDSMFSAACDVLYASVMYHPTLAVLLLPEIRENENEPLSSLAIPYSCTQHILSFAERSTELYESHPDRLEKVLDVICGAITSKRSRNGIITSLLVNKKIWAAFMDVLQITSSEQIEIDKLDDVSSKRVIHHLKIEMKIMDIFIAATCSAIESTDTSPWQHVDESIKLHFANAIRCLLDKYCKYIGEFSIQDEILRARKLASLSAIQVLVLTSQNHGFYQSLNYEENSFISLLYQSLSSDKSLEQRSFKNSCQLLYNKLMENISDSKLVYSKPFEALADLLLTPIVKDTRSSFSDIGGLEQGCLPVRVGSAWAKLIPEFSHLEVQMIHLKRLISLQDSLVESMKSLDSLMAVSLTRHPDVIPDDFDLNQLIHSFEHSIVDSLSNESLVTLNKEASTNMLLVISRMATILSQKMTRRRIDVKKIFSILMIFADEHIEANRSISPEQSQILSNLLVVSINILVHSPMGGLEAMDIPPALITKLLALSCNGVSTVACPAASLSTILMKASGRPPDWEERMESLTFMEAFDLILVEFRKERRVNSEGFNDLALRTKSLLLLISQIVKDSQSSAEILLAKGLNEILVSICHMVLDLLPNAGYPDIQGGMKNSEAIFDVSGRYFETGCRYEMHNVYCILLSLCSLLWSSLPGHRKAQTLLLRVSVIISNRLMLVINDHRDRCNMLTLGYTEEGRAAIGFICTLARLEGDWLLNQPTMMSQLRRATALFLEFAVHGIDRFQYAAVSPEEVEKYEVQLPNVALPHAFGIASVSFTTLASDDSNKADTQCPTQLSFTIASQIYTMIKYALRFQILTSPEICEAELNSLGDTWVRGEVLESLITRVASSLVAILDQQEFISFPNDQDVSAVNAINLCLEIIRGTRSLMDIMSYTIPAQTDEEIQGILHRASMSLE